MKLQRILRVPVVLQLVMGLSTCANFQPKSRIFSFLSEFAQTSRNVLAGTVDQVRDYLPPVGLLYPDDMVIFELFEYIKVKIKSPHPHLDLPVLDPFTTDSLGGDIVNDIFGNISINLQGVNITGTSSLDIGDVKMNWLPRTLHINGNFPQVIVDATYSIGGVLGGIIPVHGNGAALLSIRNLNGTGKMTLGSMDGYLYIKSVSLNYTVEELKVNFSNLMGGGRFGELLNKALSEEGPRILDLVRTDLLHFGENWLLRHINNILSKLSITLNGVIDFVKIIGTKKVNSIFSFSPQIIEEL